MLTGLTVGTARAQNTKASEPGAEPATRTQELTSSGDLHFDEEEIAHLLQEEPAARTTVLNDLIQVAGETDRDLSATHLA